jgi:ribosomal protein S12 methylthiotransferase
LSDDRLLTTPAHYAYLKIAEGCNRTCAYCAIPLMTGRYQSRPMEAVADEVRALVQKGVKEFQVIAQDSTYYGRDRYHRYALPDLLQRLSDIEGVEWLRLHYAYPVDFPQELLPVMRDRDNICKYLDIALQHCNDSVLHRMRRPISHAETIDLIAGIREKVPGIHLRTTLMVGYPGETEAHFAELLDFARAMRFERLGAFVYSEEEGTYSAQHYPDEIGAKEKQARWEELMAVQAPIAAAIAAEKIGRTLPVMIDREEGDYYIGRTEYDSPEIDAEVLVEKDGEEPLAPGHIYAVQITGATEYDLAGKKSTITNLTEYA